MIRLTLLLFGLVNATGFSQISFEKAYYRFHGATVSYGSCVTQTNDQGYVICAPIDNGNLFSFLMIKTDPYGDTIMTSHFDGFGYFFVPTFDGGFMITGSKNSHLMMVKTDSEFGTEWTKTFGEYALSGQAVCQTSDSGYCFIGNQSNGPPTIGKGFTVVRTNKNGDSQWTTSFTGWNRDFDVRSVILSPDDGFAICGTIRPYPMGPASVFLLKLNSLGDSVWMKTYHRSNSSKGYVVIQTENNGFLLVATDDPSDSPNLLFLINTNDQGDTTWTRTYNCIYDAGILAATNIKTGGYIVAGSKIVDTLSTDACLVRINVNGDTLWTRSLGTIGNEISMSVKQTIDDGFIVSGYAGLNYPSQESAVYLVKTDSLGHYSPSGVDEIMLTEDVRIFPNPFTNIINVKFNGQLNSLEILTIHGRTIYSASHLKTNSSVYSLNLANQPAGIYLLKITTEKTILIKKITKIN